MDDLLADAGSNPPPRPSLRGSWSLIATQFQGVFSENTLKYLAIFLILGLGLEPSQRDRMILLEGVLFSLPFILLSMAGILLPPSVAGALVNIATALLGHRNLAMTKRYAHLSNELLRSEVEKMTGRLLGSSALKSKGS